MIARDTNVVSELMRDEPHPAVRRAGRALPVADGYIAAICAAHGACVATRDVRPYQSAGVEAVNPWEVGKDADENPREVQ